MHKTSTQPQIHTLTAPRTTTPRIFPALISLSLLLLFQRISLSSSFSLTSSPARSKFDHFSSTVLSWMLLLLLDLDLRGFAGSSGLGECSNAVAVAVVPLRSWSPAARGSSIGLALFRLPVRSFRSIPKSLAWFCANSAAAAGIDVTVQAKR